MNQPLRILLVLLLVLLLAGHSASAQKKKKPEAGEHRWNQSALGPTFATSLSAPKGPKTFSKFAKAIAIEVGEGGDNGVAFDIDRLRYAGGWTGGFVKINGGRDALLAHHDARGEVQWWTRNDILGWTHKGQWPKAPKLGPVDPKIARFTGHWMHGNRIALVYRVGGAEMIESPWLEPCGSGKAFRRSVRVRGQVGSERMLVAEGPAVSAVETIDGLEVALARQGDSVTAVAVRGGPKPVVDGKRLCVQVGGDGLFDVLVWKGPAAELEHFVALVKSGKPEDPRRLVQPGPRRWSEILETKGELGKDDKAWTVDTLRPPFDNPWGAILHFGGHDFFANGDAAICTMEGDVWLVKGIDENLEKVRWQRHATGLHQPLGLRIVDEKIYVLGRDQITRLHDHNGDGEADFYENFNHENEVGLGGHAYSTCLETDSAGNFYYIRCNDGGKHGGTVVKIPKDGKGIEVVATGFRNPNGFFVGGPDDAITAADQQGTWIPSSRLDLVKQGGFYGFVPASKRPAQPKSYDGPLCWIPHKVDNSCGAQAWIEGERWGLPAGELLHLSYGRCTMFYALRERVGEQDQAGLWRFPFKFASGGMRARFRATDGQLYVSGLRGWQTSAPKDGCFQRVRYTGKPLHMPLGLNVHQNGLLLRFSEKLDQELAEDPASWSISHWNYRWTKAYGSKDYKVSDPEETGRDTLEVTAAKLQPDGKSVFVEVAGLQPVMQMEIAYDLETAAGDELISTIWNTIHALRSAR